MFINAHNILYTIRKTSIANLTFQRNLNKTCVEINY